MSVVPAESIPRDEHSHPEFNSGFLAPFAVDFNSHRIFEFAPEVERMVEFDFLEPITKPNEIDARKDRRAAHNENLIEQSNIVTARLLNLVYKIEDSEARQQIVRGTLEEWLRENPHLLPAPNPHLYIEIDGLVQDVEESYPYVSGIIQNGESLSSRVYDEINNDPEKQYQILRLLISLPDQPTVTEEADEVKKDNKALA